MKKESPNLNFKIKVPIYPVTIHCYFGSKKYFDETSIKDAKLKKVKNVILNEPDTYKAVVHNFGGVLVLHTKELPIVNEWKGILAHEILHIVIATMDYVGVTLSGESEEAYTYLNGYLTEQIHKNLDKHNKNYVA